MIRNFLTALRFLTILPLGKSRPKENLNEAMVFFPLVGFLIGIASLAIFSVVQKFFPGRTAVFFLLLSPILLTGGIHLDGFADFCDGFFSGGDKPEILRIMKDPHIGTWAVLGLVLLLLAKFEFLQSLPDRGRVFLLAMTASRWAQTVFGFLLPYVRPEGGLGESVAGKLTGKQVFAASAFLLPVVLWTGMGGILTFAALLGFLILLGNFFKKKLGGMTGDLFGAVSELSELIIFIGACIFGGVSNG